MVVKWQGLRDDEGRLQQKSYANGLFRLLVVVLRYEIGRGGPQIFLVLTLARQ